MLRVVSWIAGLSATGLVLVVVLVQAFAVKSEFHLLNGASQPIARATVSVAGQSFSFKNIDSGSRVSGAYRPSDSTLRVLVEMMSGEAFEGYGGYVTNGMSFRHDVVVSNTGIEIIESTRPYVR